MIPRPRTCDETQETNTTNTSTRVLPILPTPKARSSRHPSTQSANRYHTEVNRRRPPEETAGEYPQRTRMEPPAQNGRFARQSSNGGNAMDIDSAAGPLAIPARQKQPQNSLAGESYIGAEGMSLEEEEGSTGLTGNSSAEDWFNTFNADVGANQSFARYEDVSPYYVSNHKNRGAQGRLFRHHRLAGSPSVQAHLPEAAQILPESTAESNSESYRSVIDDLTVKNQKLKKKIRKLEGTRGRDQAERLFEVRIHDLPETKKLELERLLRNFSASLDPGSQVEGNSPQPSSTNITPEMQSFGSVTVPDSGYSSVPHHDQSPLTGSLHRLGFGEAARRLPKSHKQAEIVKMKIVVAKLEQLFTGGDATLGDRSQLLQQQDISNMAAADDKEATEAMGKTHHPGGVREASMMDEDANTADGLSKTPPSSDEFPEEHEQRPTRPMDLDPSRKQVAEDNIEYLTHMTESATKKPGIPDGWVYLNLIINLAQLHTISVTPPFVRKAISQVSSKLELSSDGKMVRWRGSNSTDPASSSPTISPEPTSSQTAPAAAASDKFQYRPLFYRPPSFASSTTSTTPSSTPSSRPDSPNKHSSPDLANLLIYYRNSAFCTDLSSSTPAPSSPHYERITEHPLGAPYPLDRRPSTPPSPLTTNSSTEELQFYPSAPAESPPLRDINFEVSGIGGVTPADNFAINCEARHFLQPTSTRRPHTRRIPHRIPPAATAPTNADDAQQWWEPRCEVSVDQVRRLEPSRVPEASYMFATPSESSEDFGYGSGSGSDGSGMGDFEMDEMERMEEQEMERRGREYADDDEESSSSSCNSSEGREGRAVKRPRMMGRPRSEEVVIGDLGF